MARRCRLGSRRPMTSSWAYANANACSGSSNSGFANPGPFWREPIPHCRSGIKETPEINERRLGGSVGFQQQGSRCRMWVPPETKDPIVYRHPTRKSVGYFAAVRLRAGEVLFRRDTRRFNGESFWEFLKVFQQASAVTDRRVLAISDNAQY